MWTREGLLQDEADFGRTLERSRVTERDPVSARTRWGELVSETVQEVETRGPEDPHRKMCKEERRKGTCHSLLVFVRVS